MSQGGESPPRRNEGEGGRSEKYIKLISFFSTTAAYLGLKIAYYE
jgi:hypothetical protein